MTSTYGTALSELHVGEGDPVISEPRETENYLPASEPCLVEHDLPASEPCLVERADRTGEPLRVQEGGCLVEGDVRAGELPVVEGDPAVA
ncbi:hypothetical protein G6048_39155 [Streptomyces sp. YC419]|uniref:Uncharacterized protein n=1 Tax=Streptomyces ureilyticus TaxID=1775131 RepID=A0ABX0E4R6_9ACTN|nr:hypothetical protein [Streptomyces ureilyticus]